MFHILVVEDDAKLRSLFCTVLNRSGYLTVPASGGREALELLDSEYIDLIISDIMMPGMDGYPDAEGERLQPSHTHYYGQRTV